MQKFHASRRLLPFAKRRLLSVLILTGLCSGAYADGHLLAVGGMLKASNAPVYNKLIELAGGTVNARIAIMPTASGSLSSSKRFQAELVALGIPAEHISIVAIDKQNYLSSMNDPAAVKPLTEASAVWFVGGDQARLAKALLQADGSPSLAMQAIRAVYEKGGVIAGTSAGASILGASMPTAYGVVMDTLDFGVASRADQRGTALLNGAGLFKAGIIDQHLDKIEETSAGRAARMASYLVGQTPAKGFGLDTNTAIWIKPDGQLQVIGEGYLTVMDAGHASKKFGVYGTELNNIRLAMLGNGDSYDLTSDKVTPAAGKEAIKDGDQYLVGNQLITDLSAVSAIDRAVLYGLADNTAQQQLGLMTRYNPLNGYHYGYRFEFSKGDGFSAASALHDALTNYSVQGVQLNIRPVDANLRDPANSAPTDAGKGAQGDVIRAVTFRGLMTLDPQRAFQPQRPITRAEMANALQMTLAGELQLGKQPTLSDVKRSDPLFEQINIVLSNGWMHSGERFSADQALTRGEWALACRALVERLQAAPLSKSASLNDLSGLPAEQAQAAALTVGEGWLSAKNGHFDPQGKVPRSEVASVLAKATGLLSTE